MDDPGKAIFEILKNNSDVSALTRYGTSPSYKWRIFPLNEPQELAIPCITYEQISGDPNNTKSGPSITDVFSFQINSIGEASGSSSAAAAAKDLAKKVRAALDYVSGTFDGVKVQHISYDGNEHTDWEDNTRKKGVCRVVQTYKIRVNA